MFYETKRLVLKIWGRGYFYYSFTEDAATKSYLLTVLLIPLLTSVIFTVLSII